MLRFLKQLLYRALPTSWYLAVMQRGFFLLFDLHILSCDGKFKFHYAAKKLIREDDIVVDIGANLGYFSKVFARCNRLGKLYALEPIPDFYQRLKHLLRSFNQVEVIHAALGAKDGILPMVMPVQRGVLRTGLPHIISEAEAKQHANVQRVKVLEAQAFFHGLPKVDYIKCDVEGYEWTIFSTLTQELNRLRPCVQIEISEQFVSSFCALFEDLDYVQFGIYDGKLLHEQGKQRETSDFLFIPREKADDILANFNR